MYDYIRLKQNTKKMKKIIAKNSEKKGLLPMKQNKEQESKKSYNQKNIETCNFIKNAFCIDGSVEMILSDKPITSKLYFKCEDSTRGNFFVAYGEINSKSSPSRETIKSTKEDKNAK